MSLGFLLSSSPSLVLVCCFRIDGLLAWWGFLGYNGLSEMHATKRSGGKGKKWRRLIRNRPLFLAAFSFSFFYAKNKECRRLSYYFGPLFLLLLLLRWPKIMAAENKRLWIFAILTAIFVFAFASWKFMAVKNCKAVYNCSGPILFYSGAYLFGPLLFSAAAVWKRKSRFWSLFLAPSAKMEEETAARKNRQPQKEMKKKENKLPIFSVADFSPPLRFGQV